MPVFIGSQRFSDDAQNREGYEKYQKQQHNTILDARRVQIWSLDTSHVDNSAFSVDNPVDAVHKTSRFQWKHRGFRPSDRWITCRWIASGCGHAGPSGRILRRKWG